jgi:hypothetical protein
MAKPGKLKVFRTPIGFHDAYVAAPSQKAALEAWGSDHNLFARGEAELVDDPALTAEPLAHPGRVIKRLRGTAEEQLAALPPDKKRQPARSSDARKKPAKPVPRPTRASLDKAEEALAAAEQRHAEALAALAEQEEELRRRRRAAEKARDAELDKLRATIDRQRDIYERKLEEWRG